MPSFPSSYIKTPSDETPESSNEYISKTKLALAGGNAIVAMLGALYYYKYHYVAFGGKKWFWQRKDEE